ncbi:hypothetical protein CVIRNUC_005147 [Coccomyxa viridis]|uniref:Amino acid transporter transmembrane domain-containing protein n=1 Tax=Coccomyxa viridis TaxID=1274662 RepID=A0AAV1I7P9_9CHLO|nr:hypothetical protein CVIRNUC_005147 [Coccomyxa viridis]
MAKSHLGLLAGSSGHGDSSKARSWESGADAKPHSELHIDADAAGHSGHGPRGQSWRGFLVALCTEGHTAWDCLLTVSCAQIGQVMLVMPHSMALMGVRNGIVIAFVAALGGLWTMFLLAALYLEMKARSIRHGTWYDADGKRRRATQYHEVMGYWGGPFMKYIAQILVAVHLVGTSTAQIIACSGNNYAIMPQHNKRFYALVWGAILVCASLLPTFRHFHAMRNTGHFAAAYSGGWLYVLTLIFPHSITANLAFPDQVFQQVPLLYMWEKLIRVHSRPAYIRLPLRLPVSCFIWLLALAFPFYATLNALYAAFCEPWVAFIFPCLMHTIVFRREATRKSAALKPFKFLQVGNWAPVFSINVAIIVLWGVFQFGFGFVFAVKRLVTNVSDFGIFAECYQCEEALSVASTM